MTCGKCGQPHVRAHPSGKTVPSCAAHRTKARTPNGGLLPCGRSPLRGQDVCTNHGGQSPQALAAAQRRLDTGQRAGCSRRSMSIVVMCDRT